jgi:hypothetical protein
VNPVLVATSIAVRIGAKTLLDDVALSLGPGEVAISFRSPAAFA